MLWLARALLWLVISAGLLLAGFTVLAAVLLVPGVIAHGGPPAQLQREALGTLYSGLVVQALLPELALSAVLWLIATGAFPILDRSWPALWGGTFVLAAAAFPPVGHYMFAMWQPTRPRDYAVTLLLLAGAATAALLIPRAISPVLGPGCFTNTAKRGIVREP
ncbi:MAG TPA: hypothetical protein VMR50_12480 [Myxococcota bacterium]|nr:hypothetical protein [Myxococcota bacterium]